MSGTKNFHLNNASERELNEFEHGICMWEVRDVSQLHQDPFPKTSQHSTRNGAQIKIKGGQSDSIAVDLGSIPGIS